MALEAINGFHYKSVSEHDVNNEIYADMCMKDQFNLYHSVLPKEDNILNGLFCDESGNKINIKFDHGTTTLGFKYRNGIILAADSRATAGNYIGSGSVRKLIPINKFIVGTMAGGAADCTYWERVLSKQCRIYELRNRERISVAAASKLLSNMVYQYKGYGLSLGVMIAGIDKKGAGLYYVDNEGNRLSGNMFSAGSGSLCAYSILDSNYKFEMTDEEAQEIARRAVYHATYRDGASGGIVRVMHIGDDGWKTISEQDCYELHEKYEAEKQSRI